MEDFSNVEGTEEMNPVEAAGTEEMVLDSEVSGTEMPKATEE